LVVVAADTADFTAAWERFFRTTRRLRARAGRLPVDGLSLPQYHLLEALRDADELTVGELAETAGVAAPTATRMLDCIAREGHIERRHSETDRRAVLVSLTPAGRDAVADAHERAEAFRRRVFESLGSEERDDATALLRRLADVLEEQMP
jgi:MarR family transcriptional regulator, organic hydroperoxide resistance regulator